MTTHFLIIHGTGGYPEKNWFPWLKTELEKTGNTANIPHFPTPEGQSFEAWRKVAEVALANRDPQNTVLIGHSMGAFFALRLAELSPKPYKAIFAVAPFACEIGLPDFDTLNATFVNHKPDWERIKRGAGCITCLAGDNDPYVPQAAARDVAEKANAELIIIPGGGHLNTDAGYLKFPLLLDKIRELS
jgi:uncharacterized protein